MIEIRIQPTTLAQLQALMQLDLSPFLDPQFILAEAAGELADTANGEDTSKSAKLFDGAPAAASTQRRGPGRPRKTDAAPPSEPAAADRAPALAQAQEPAAAPATPAVAPANANPPPVETAGAAPSTGRADVSAAMDAFMKAGGTSAILRSVVQETTGVASLSQVPPDKLEPLLRAIETATLKL